MLVHQRVNVRNPSSESVDCRFSVFFLVTCLFVVVVFVNLRVVSDRLSELHADLTCLGVKLGGNMYQRL